MASFAAIGGMLFGYDTGIVSGAIPLINVAFDIEDKPVQSEMIVSATVLFAIVGSVIGGPINTAIGRRRSTLLASLLFACGAIGVGVAQSVAQLVLYRAVLGIAVGMASQGVPMYIAETSPPHLRGTLTSAFNFTVTSGQVVACVVAGLLCEVKDGWRWMMALAGVPAVVQFFGMLVLPESPRWLAEKGRLDEALEVLTKLRKNRKKAQIELEFVADELEQCRAEASARHGGFWSKQRSAVAFRKELVLGCGMCAIQAFSGINTIMYYSASILLMAGMSRSHAIWGAVLPAFCNASVSGISMLIVERTGRRPIALFSLAMIAVTLVLFSASFYFQEDLGPTLGGFVVLLTMMMYIVVFAIGMAPVPWILNAEIYALEYRSLGTSLATFVNWASNFVVSMTFLSLVQVLTKYGAFLLYACVGVFGFFFVYFLQPETGGKTLEEIQELFAPPRSTGILAGGSVSEPLMPPPGSSKRA